MDEKEIIKKMYQLIVEDNGNVYKDLFSKTNFNDVKDSYWKEALTFYTELSNQKRDIFFRVIAQVQVDTVSNLLALLDGTITIEDGIEFDVSIKDTGKMINGELQGLFLEFDEENRS